MLPPTLPAHFTPRTCCTVLHNYLFDLNLEYGLPTPIGCLDSSAVLSFQWGRYQDLSNLYCLATTLSKLHSTPTASYTIITNNEVDNHHNNSQFPSHWTNLANRGALPRPGTPNHSLVILTWQHSHFGLLHLTHTSATWIDSLHHPPPPDLLARSLNLLSDWNSSPPPPVGTLRFLNPPRQNDSDGAWSCGTHALLHTYFITTAPPDQPYNPPPSTPVPRFTPYTLSYGTTPSAPPPSHRAATTFSTPSTTPHYPPP